MERNYGEVLQLPSEVQRLFKKDSSHKNMAVPDELGSESPEHGCNSMLPGEQVTASFSTRTIQ